MAISSIPDPYNALGLTPEATAAEIRSAYKKLMLKCHPDKVHDESQKEEKAQQYQKVMEAYELLSDPKKKRRYDLDLQRQAGSESRPTSATAAADPAAKAEKRETSEEGRKEKSRERAQRHESNRPMRRESTFEEYSRQREMPREKEGPREKDYSREREVPREKDYSREREVPREKDYTREREVPREKDYTREREVPREKDYTREREVPKEKEVPLEREKAKDRDVPSEMPMRDSDVHHRHMPRETEKSREKETSRDRERHYKEHKEPRESKEHSHSRDSSKEHERKHTAKPETSPPPISHQKRYEEERRLEEEKLQKARNIRLYGNAEGPPVVAGGVPHTDRADSQERRRREEERERQQFEMNEKIKKAREQTRAQEAEELDGFNMDDIHPKTTETRRGSTQKRETSPKESPASSRERKTSHSPSHRKESVSPTRGETLHSSRQPIPMPPRTGYGSVPTAAPGSTFASFSSSASPRRRHSVSSQDPMKAPRLYPQDSGYSSPNHPTTPLSPDGKIPQLKRSSTESAERSSGERGFGWKEVAFKVYMPEDPVEAAAMEARIAAAAGYPLPVPGHLPRRKTTSHHPLETANLTSSPPPLSGEFRKTAPIPSPASGSSAYYYPSPTSANYASPTSANYASQTHGSHHFSYSSGASSVHPQQPQSRSHSSRHANAGHHHSASPHSSPKVPQDAFASMNGVRSPSMSSASTVHPSSGYHYSRPEYFAPPPVRGHTY